VTCTIQ